MGTNAIFDHFHGDQIVTAYGDDDIRIFFRWLHIHFVHGFDRRKILRNNGIERTAAFVDVTLDTAEDADITA